MITAPAADGDQLLFDTEAGQAALADIIATLTAEAAGPVDAEDLDHYERLLHTPVTRLTHGTTEDSARGWAA